MQAVHQSDAAVVRPDIFRSLMKIVPAPRKPSPVMTEADMRTRSVSPMPATKIFVIITSAEASLTMIYVRKPAA